MLAHKIPTAVKPIKYVLVLVGLSVLTIPIGVWPAHSLEYLSSTYIKTVLLFLFIFTLCRSVQDIQRVMWGCGIGLTVLVINGVASGNLGRPVGIVDEAYEYASKTYDPNDFALVLAMMMPVLLYLLSMTRRMIARLALIAMMLIGMYGIVLTQSRGGFISLLVIGVLILRRSTLTHGQKMAIGAVALIVFGVLAGSSFWERIRTIWDPQDEYDRQAGGRTELWKTGLKLMLTHPWGVGIDGFVYAEGLSHGGAGKWAAAHNTLIQVGVDLGIAGLIAFVLMMLFAFRSLRAMQQGLRPPAKTKQFARQLRSAFSRPKVPLLGKQEGKPDDSAQLVMLAASLEISLTGFAVGGFFLSQAYGTLLYVMIALTLVTVRLAGRLNVPEPISVRRAAAAGGVQRAPVGRRVGRSLPAPSAVQRVNEES